MLAVLLVLGCARGGARRAELPRAPSPLHLGGQRVLVLPLQSIVGLPEGGRERLNAEILFALGERDGRVIWIPPAELQRALSRSPAYAAAPHALPADPVLQHREPRVTEPLAGELRRYSALMDARLVLLLREARFARAADADVGNLRIGAVLLDARSGRVLWWGEAAGDASATPDPAAAASAAAALAERLLAIPARESSE
ncbi:hypothetical protein BH23GEM7_BH23GEM7_05340 [soil metagenome]